MDKDMQNLDKKIGIFIIEYNKIAAISKQLDKPNVFYVFQQFLQVFENFENEIERRIIGAIFVIAFHLNNSLDIDMYEEVLDKLGVLDEVEFIEHLSIEIIESMNQNFKEND